MSEFNSLKTVLFLLCGAILVVSCTSVGAGSLAYVPIDQSGDWDISLNGEWLFMLNGPAEDFFKPNLDVSEWSTIKVPGNWEVQGFEEPLYKEPREGLDASGSARSRDVAGFVRGCSRPGCWAARSLI